MSGATLEPEYKAHVADECKAADHLAIVFVHGVGFQNQGETLLAWSDRLIRMVAARHGNANAKAPDLVQASAIDLQGGKLSSIEVRIPAANGQRAQHWRLTEAFWAAAIQPPSVGTVLRWLGARGAAVLSAPGAAVLRNSVYAGGVVIGLLVVYAALRAATSIIPSESIRKALIVPLDRRLTDWSGDMHVLLFDPAQSANIRTRVMEAINGIAQDPFRRVAVIAHSGGAVASYMTLTDDVLWPKPAPPTRSQVVALITHGQGLNIAWRLCNLAEGRPCRDAVDTERRLATDLRRNHPNLKWSDYYSEGDLVSESELRPPECLQNAVPSGSDSVHTENLPSDPHGSFWDNDEEFLLPVVHRLQAAARDTTTATAAVALSSDDEWIRKRMFRIGMSSFTTRVVSSAMLAAIVGSALFGGVRMDDLGAAVADVVKEIPIVQWLGAPPDTLAAAHDDAWWLWPQVTGALVVSALLVLAALFPLTRLRLETLATEHAGSRRQRLLVRAVDFGAACLPLAAVAAWAPFALPLNDRYAPALALVPMVILAGILLVVILVRFPEDREPALPNLDPLRAAFEKGWIVMGLLALIAILAVGTLLAIIGDAEYGGMRLGSGVLGAAVVWLLYRVVGGVAHWRWVAWDDQEREQFRQIQRPSVNRPKRRRWGIGFDLVSIAFCCVAAIILAATIGAALIGTRESIVGGVATVILIALVWLVGSAQDAANSGAGVAPTEVKALPSAS